MAFQATVGAQIPFGVVGELHNNSPLRGLPGLLNTPDAANNVVGRALTFVSGGTGSWATGSAGANDPKPAILAVGGAGVFAGILANPKVYAGYGGVAGPLSPTVSLPNGMAVECVSEGDIIVVLPAGSAPGDPVYFTQATGVLTRTAPGAAAPAASTGPIGKVGRYTNAGASLAVLELFPQLPDPA